MIRYVYTVCLCVVLSYGGWAGRQICNTPHPHPPFTTLDCQMRLNGMDLCICCRHYKVLPESSWSCSQNNISFCLKSTVATLFLVKYPAVYQIYNGYIMLCTIFTGLSSIDYALITYGKIAHYYITFKIISVLSKCNARWVTVGHWSRLLSDSLFN